jgi:hypothetical protein
MKSVNCKMQQKRTQAFLVIWTGSLLQWFLDDLSFTFNAEDDRRSQLFIRGVVIPLTSSVTTTIGPGVPHGSMALKGLGRCRPDLPLSIINLLEIRANMPSFC